MLYCGPCTSCATGTPERGSKTDDSELLHGQSFGRAYMIIIGGRYTCTCTWVIPNHFNQSFYMTLSELDDETWYVSSTCGFVKPDKVSHLVALWLPS